MSNEVLERIHQVLGNIVRTFNIFTQTYVGKNDPWLGILAAAAFATVSKTNMQKGYSTGQLIFGRDIILPIKNKVYWELLHHQNQAQINKDNISKNRNRVDYDYKVIDNFMLTNQTAYKYETLYKVSLVITHCFTNGTVNFHNSATQITYNIRHINLYKSDTKVEDSSSKNMSDDVSI